MNNYSSKSRLFKLLNHVKLFDHIMLFIFLIHNFNSFINPWDKNLFWAPFEFKFQVSLKLGDVLMP